MLPKGSSGKEYKELTRLIEWVAENPVREFGNVCYSCHISPSFAPSKNSKSRDHLNALDRILVQWRNGDF